jgi:hypothetical protein
VASQGAALALVMAISADPWLVPRVEAKYPAFRRPGPFFSAKNSTLTLLNVHKHEIFF